MRFISQGFCEQSVRIKKDMCENVYYSFIILILCRLIIASPQRKD